MARDIRDIVGNNRNPRVETMMIGATELTETHALNFLSGLTSSNVGTVTTAATTAVVEYGNAIEHLTKLTMTNFAVGTSGDNANLALGAKFYTWPTGVN